MPSDRSAEAPYGGLLDALPGDPTVDSALSDRALVEAMLRLEVAVALAQAEHGVLPADAADDVVRSVRSFEPDLAALGAAAADSGNPVVPLVRALDRPGAHLGLTSQDVLDTAFALVTRAALSRVRLLLDETAEDLLDVAAAHADTPMVGRTLGRPAAPTTYGLVVCGWHAGLAAAVGATDDLLRGLAVQLGGAVGTRSALGPPEVVPTVAHRLGLRAPVLPWHTERSQILRTAAVCAEITGTAGKVATDILELSTLGELQLGHDAAQASRGGSSAMPHKRNPVAAVLVRAAAAQAPGPLAVLAAAQVQDLQRATGAWHAEWRPLRELLHLAGGAAAELGRLVRDVVPDPQAMADALSDGGPALTSESLLLLLTGPLGRLRAHEVVRDAVRPGRSADEIATAVAGSAPVDPVAVRAALDPAAAARPAGELARRYLDTYLEGR